MLASPVLVVFADKQITWPLLVIPFVTAKYFLVFCVSFRTLLVLFALSHSICGVHGGYTCLHMIYKHKNLLSFILVSIVERAQETFSVLVNVLSC